MKDLRLVNGRRYRLRPGPCPCGCGAPVDLPKVYATTACRQRAWAARFKREHGVSYRRSRVLGGIARWRT